jgi:hypothetical protein
MADESPFCHCPEKSGREGGESRTKPESGDRLGMNFRKNLRGKVGIRLKNAIPIIREGKLGFFYGHLSSSKSRFFN